MTTLQDRERMYDEQIERIKSGAVTICSEWMRGEGLFAYARATADQGRYESSYISGCLTMLRVARCVDGWV
jgi:hypothetical protein